MMRAAVITFPGSNCEHDTVRALTQAGIHAELVWHRETSLQAPDVVLLPGGFSYGDYLRSGAIARFSPIMEAVRTHALAGGAVIGICNGFQVLCEAGLLPGALTKNAGLLFTSRTVRVTIERSDTICTVDFEQGARLSLPIANGEGRFVADEQTLDQLEAEGHVVLRYAENPNGSARGIAGICNPQGTIVGMMPHPERAANARLNSGEGGRFFSSIVTSFHSQMLTSPPNTSGLNRDSYVE